MILPPWLLDVRTHASSENVCGPDCQYGDAPWTVVVLFEPGKLVAGSDSLRSAPAMLRWFWLFSVRSFEPARSYAVVPEVSPIRHSQSGLSERTDAAYVEALGVPLGM